MTDTKPQQKGQVSDSQMTLNPNAPSFVPNFLKKPSTQQQTTSSDSSQQQAKSFNIDAPVFKPSFTSQSSAQAANQTSATNYSIPNYASSEIPQPVFSPILNQPVSGNLYGGMVVGQDPINGYVNPFLAQKQGAAAVVNKKQTNPKDDQKKKTYSIDFMLSLRPQFKDRPSNMALLDFPHKKKGKIRSKNTQQTEADKFNQTVRELRILLNKLSKDNFETVTKEILKEFFTPSLLNELMKIIFMKSTTETAYLELYVKLCIHLFKKYDDKENKEMNFKKLLLMKCQKQFYKMQEKEEQERKSRRQSMAEGDAAQAEGDFNKQMLYVFDKDEIKFRLKQQLFGNMRLIVELWLHHQIPEGIILTCITSLLEDINDQSVEILCNMLTKISQHVVKRANQELNYHKDPQGSGKKPKKPLSSFHINLDYIETTLNQLFAYRHSEHLSSRVKFKIQDVIEEYEHDWKNVIFGERVVVDNEGFQQKYVPSKSIFTQPVSEGNGRSRKNSTRKGETNAYMYVKKQKKAGADSNTTSENNSANKRNDINTESGKKNIQNLLNALKPEDFHQKYEIHSSEEDEDVKRIMSRKVSMNEQNVIGTNFEKYNDQKPSQEIRRKIANYFLEYKDNYDKNHAVRCFEDICKENNLPKHIFIGYIFHNAFSQDQQGWQDIFDLIIEHLFKTEKLFTEKDLLEGVHVSLANFIDTLIDYPNSKEYSFQMFEKLGEIGILQKEMIEKYKKHVENLCHDDADY